MQRTLGATTTESQLSEALIGTHTLESKRRRPSKLRDPPLLLGDGSSDSSSQIGETEDIDNNRSAFERFPSLPAPPQGQAIMTAAMRLPELAAGKVLDLVSNPVLILLFVFFLFYYQKDLRRWYNSGSRDDGFEGESPIEVRTDPTLGAPEDVKSPAEEPPQTKPEEDSEKPAAEPSPVPEDHDSKPQTDPAGPADPAAPAAPLPASDGDGSPAVKFAEPVNPREKSEPQREGDEQEASPPPEPGKKKKAHRGSRGGAKHKKRKDKRELSQSRDDDPPQATVQEVIDKAKRLGEQPQLEPDIQTVTNDPEEVSGPILRMGSLEVDEDQQLGTGSNGTVVFAGKWDGRAVAVKRMLIQFNEIASQETRLLRESDDHPNGKLLLLRGYHTLRIYGTDLSSHPLLCPAAAGSLPLYRP